MPSLPTDRDTTLDELDAALIGVRRVLQLPAYRRRVLDGVGTDVPLSTLRVVRAVDRTGRQASPSIGDVAELLGIDPSTASRAVDDAVARRLLSRDACDRDRRRQRLRLTTEGVLLLERATGVRRSMLAEITGEWETDHLADLVRRLNHLLDDFEQQLIGS